MAIAPQSLAAHIAAAPIAAPTANIFGWLMSAISVWLASIREYLLQNADPRKLIDTPEERAAIEAKAIAGFDKLARPPLVAKFGDVMAAMILAQIEPGLAKLLDQMLVSLSHTLPPSPPPPPVTL